MLSAVLRTAARPALSSARLTARPAAAAAHKALSTSAVRRSSKAPEIYGSGGKAGEIASDEEQATGLERFQLLGELEGVDMFDTAPLDSSRVGTPKDPIKVYSLVRTCLTYSFCCGVCSWSLRYCFQEPERIVGCSGSPAESHDVIWFNLEEKRQRRCPECGSGAYLTRVESVDRKADLVYVQSTLLTSRVTLTPMRTRTTRVHLPCSSFVPPRETMHKTVTRTCWKGPAARDIAK